jgi:mannosylglycerate hydrolase
MVDESAHGDKLSVMVVSHTHWDREWYRPFEAFRARLVDTIDMVLDHLAVDPGWSFLLDGQTAVLEDYLAVRPGRRAELERACRGGRIGIGPWYVQPDSLLPSGEAHVRNLLEGRRVGEDLGPVSRVAYTPDSFGHPAQFPQLFAGFGLGAFVYWRGNGSELDRLAPVWRWVAPDGTAVTACHLGEGYFAASYLGDDVDAAVDRLERLVAKLADPAGAEVLVMNGLDHAPPDLHTAEICAALAARTGWAVRRGLLDEYVAGLDAPAVEYRGELVGGRVANLLPGVWSARLSLKLRNRRAEAALEGWAEPSAAWALVFGLADERPSVRLAWRSLLVNQAHDSIGGCSTDLVHEQMIGRYDTADALASETTARVLERLSGLGADRMVLWREGTDIAVWNPSPHPVTDVVRLPVDGHPAFMIGARPDEIHPLVMASMVHTGMSVDGAPARVISSDDTGRLRMIPGQPAWDVEFVAADVPAWGWRRYRLAPGPAAPSVEDDGRRVEVGDLSLEMADDGTLTLARGALVFPGLLGVDDVGDRGDTYDADPVAGPGPELASVDVRRHRHVSGIEELVVRRRFRVPARLDPAGDQRVTESVELALDVRARLVPGTDRVDVEVSIDNTAEDHRLRLLFPTPGGDAMAATTFDAVVRRPDLPDATGWIHPPPPTFPHQGWVARGGLTIGAAGLPEAEVRADGAVAVTLVRAVGRLSGLDLRTRPIPAGPGMTTPGAQCQGRLTAELHLWCGDRPVGETAAAARAAELGLRAVVAGPRPLVEPATALLELEPRSLLLSAIKAPERGEGLIVRVVNVEAEPVTAALRFGVDVSDAVLTRLDEHPTGEEVGRDGATVTFPVAAHAIRTVLVTLVTARP